MAFQHQIVGEVVVILWELPEEGDPQKMKELVAGARAEMGTPVVFTPIVPISGALPSDVVRKEMSAILPLLLEDCAVIHLILEGSGMMQATKRIIAAGFLLALGSKKMGVFGTLEEGLQAAPLTDGDVNIVLQNVRGAGLRASA